MKHAMVHTPGRAPLILLWVCAVAVATAAATTRSSDERMTFSDNELGVPINQHGLPRTKRAMRFQAVSEHAGMYGPNSHPSCGGDACGDDSAHDGDCCEACTKSDNEQCCCCCESSSPPVAPPPEVPTLPDVYSSPTPQKKEKNPTPSPVPGVPTKPPTPADSPTPAVDSPTPADSPTPVAETPTIVPTLFPTLPPSPVPSQETRCAQHKCKKGVLWKHSASLVCPPDDGCNDKLCCVQRCDPGHKCKKGTLLASAKAIECETAGCTDAWCCSTPGGDSTPEPTPAPPKKCGKDYVCKEGHLLSQAESIECPEQGGCTDDLCCSPAGSNTTCPVCETCSPTPAPTPPQTCSDYECSDGLVLHGFASHIMCPAAEDSKGEAKCNDETCCHQSPDVEPTPCPTTPAKECPTLPPTPEPTECPKCAECPACGNVTRCPQDYKCKEPLKLLSNYQLMECPEAGCSDDICCMPDCPTPPPTPACPTVPPTPAPTPPETCKGFKCAKGSLLYEFAAQIMCKGNKKDGCTKELCCHEDVKEETPVPTPAPTPLETCKGFKCPKDMPAHSFAEHIHCPGGKKEGCTKEMCCQPACPTPDPTPAPTPPVTCKEFKCPKDMPAFDFAQHIMCPGNKLESCTKEMCCELQSTPTPTAEPTACPTPDPTPPPVTCKAFKCPKNMQPHALKDQLICAGGQCNKDICCKTECPDCPVGNVTHCPKDYKCKAPLTLINNHQMMECPNSKCTDDICCLKHDECPTPPPTPKPTPCPTPVPTPLFTCKAFKCPEDRLPFAHAEHIQCPGGKLEGCTKAICCQAPNNPTPVPTPTPPTCADYQCPADMPRHSYAAQILCPGGRLEGCTKAICCESTPPPTPTPVVVTCQDFACPSGRTKFSFAQHINCPGNQKAGCTAEICCAPVVTIDPTPAPLPCPTPPPTPVPTPCDPCPNCTGIVRCPQDFSCPPPLKLRNKYQLMECPLGQCSQEVCCEPPCTQDPTSAPTPCPTPAPTPHCPSDVACPPPRRQHRFLQYIELPAGANAQDVCCESGCTGVPTPTPTQVGGFCDPDFLPSNPCGQGKTPIQRANLTKCPDQGCTHAICCEDVKKLLVCSPGHDCGKNHLRSRPQAQQIHCPESGCNDELCCMLDCALYQCKNQTSTLRKHLSSIRCPLSTGCSDELCCLTTEPGKKNSTMDKFCTAHQCTAGHLKPEHQSLKCPLGPDGMTSICTDDLCCESTCDGYQCQTGDLIESAPFVVCPKGGCTDAWCCCPECPGGNNCSLWKQTHECQPKGISTYITSKGSDPCGGVGQPKCAELCCESTMDCRIYYDTHNQPECLDKNKKTWKKDKTTGKVLPVPCCTPGDTKCKGRVCPDICCEGKPANSTNCSVWKNAPHECLNESTYMPERASDLCDMPTYDLCKVHCCQGGVAMKTCEDYIDGRSISEVCVDPGQPAWDHSQNKTIVKEAQDVAVVCCKGDDIVECPQCDECDERMRKAELDWDDAEATYEEKIEAGKEICKCVFAIAKTGVVVDELSKALQGKSIAASITSAVTSSSSVLRNMASNALSSAGRLFSFSFLQTATGSSAQDKQAVAAARRSVRRYHDQIDKFGDGKDVSAECIACDKGIGGTEAQQLTHYTLIMTLFKKHKQKLYDWTDNDCKPEEDDNCEWLKANGGCIDPKPQFNESRAKHQCEGLDACRELCCYGEEQRTCGWFKTSSSCIYPKTLFNESRISWPCTNVSDCRDKCCYLKATYPPTPSPTSLTPRPTYTPTPEPSHTPTPEPSHTPTPEPTWEPTPVPSPPSYPLRCTAAGDPHASTTRWTKKYYGMKCYALPKECAVNMLSNDDEYKGKSLKVQMYWFKAPGDKKQTFVRGAAVEYDGHVMVVDRPSRYKGLLQYGAKGAGKKNIKWGTRGTARYGPFEVSFRGVSPSYKRFKMKFPTDNLRPPDPSFLEEQSSVQQQQHYENKKWKWYGKKAHQKIGTGQYKTRKWNPAIIVRIPEIGLQVRLFVTIYLNHYDMDVWHGGIPKSRIPTYQGLCTYKTKKKSKYKSMCNSWIEEQHLFSFRERMSLLHDAPHYQHEQLEYDQEEEDKKADEDEAKELVQELALAREDCEKRNMLKEAERLCASTGLPTHMQIDCMVDMCSAPEEVKDTAADIVEENVELSKELHDDDIAETAFGKEKVAIMMNDHQAQGSKQQAPRLDSAEEHKNNNNNKNNNNKQQQHQEAVGDTQSTVVEQPSSSPCGCHHEPVCPCAEAGNTVEVPVQMTNA